LKADYR